MYFYLYIGLRRSSNFETTIRLILAPTKSHTGKKNEESLCKEDNIENLGFK